MALSKIIHPVQHVTVSKLWTAAFKHFCFFREDDTVLALFKRSYSCVETMNCLKLLQKCAFFLSANMFCLVKLPNELKQVASCHVMTRSLLFSTLCHTAGYERGFSSTAWPLHLHVFFFLISAGCISLSVISRWNICDVKCAAAAAAVT